jgi:hypothetical protein
MGVPAKALNGRNGPCLFCGGKDRARFTDYKDEGFYFCNQCGSYPGGKFLAKFKGWSMAETAREIERLIRTSTRVSRMPRRPPKLPDRVSVEAMILLDDSIPFDQAMQMVSDLQFNKPDVKSVRDCALWLRKYHPDKLEPWLASHHPDVREWLETQ